MVLNATVNQVDAERLRLGMKATIRSGRLQRTSSFRARWWASAPCRKPALSVPAMWVRFPIRIKIDSQRSAADSGSHWQRGNGDEFGEEHAACSPFGGVRGSGGSFVFVQGPEGWLKKKVDLGLSSFTNVAVRSGLQNGDVIALQRPCTAVRAGPAGPASPCGNRGHSATTGEKYYREVLCHRRIKDRRLAWGNRIRSASRSLPGPSACCCAAAGCLRHIAYTGTTEVEVAVARARRGDFVISVRTRGDIKSARSADFEGAAGAWSAHRPPGGERPDGAQGRSGRGVRPRPAGAERDQRAPPTCSRPKATSRRQRPPRRWTTKPMP